MKWFCLLLVLFNVPGLLAQEQATITPAKFAVVDGEDKVYRDSLLVAKYTYKNGIKEGSYTEFFYSSLGEMVFKETGNFVAGLKQGKAKTSIFSGGKKYGANENYYVDGQLHGLGSVYEATDTLVHAIFNQGVMDGYANRQAYTKVYDETGYQFSRWQFFQECYYKNGVRDGYYIEVSISEIELRGKYTNGLRDSVWNFYITYGDYRGELQRYFTYVNGKLEGPAESYYAPVTDTVDGLLMRGYTPMNLYLEYKNDQLHGEYIKTTSDGRLLEQGFYVNGKRQGPWEFGRWQEGLWVIVKGEMIDDRMQGKWNCYDLKNRLRIKIALKNDTADGTWSYYDEYGNLMHERVFDMAKELSVTNYQGMENGFTSIGISYVPGDSNHLVISTVRDDVTGYETYLILFDSMPRLDTLANGYIDVRNGLYNDTFLHRDGVAKAYTHDTLFTLQNFSKNHLHGEQVFWDFIQGVRFERTYDMDTLLDERFYFLDGKPYKGVYELLTESPPNREVIRIKKGRRKGYTEIYGRLTGRLIGRVKY